MKQESAFAGLMKQEGTEEEMEEGEEEMEDDDWEDQEVEGE